MLRIFAQRGDTIHIVFPDGSNGMIGVTARCYLEFRFPQTVRIKREKRKPDELIINNQKS